MILVFGLIAEGGTALAVAHADPARVTRIAIVSGANSTETELKAAEILKSRIPKRSTVTLESFKEDDPNAGGRIDASEVAIVVGAPAGNALTARLMTAFGMALPRFQTQPRSIEGLR